MSATLQGQTTSNSIDVDSLPAALDLPFGKQWREKQTSAMKFPAASLKAGVKVLYEAPKPKAESQVIELEDIPKLDRVPPADVINRARKLEMCNRKSSAQRRL